MRAVRVVQLVLLGVYAGAKVHVGSHVGIPDSDLNPLAHEAATTEHGRGIQDASAPYDAPVVVIKLRGWRV